MILGLRTALYPAPDLAAAKRRYTDALGIAPYFVAAVRDLFGNRFALIENPHFDVRAVR